ncbi:CatB-related O-acetyltransferase [Desulfovibrio sp. OttesenSCG-928-I05]|nr:CatB-related O-acetyltransferase [Desulfovibrio sp. OttesenSCG-928-I05]
MEPKNTGPKYVNLHSYSGAAYISKNVTIGKYCSIATAVVIDPEENPIYGLSTSHSVCKYTGNTESVHIDIGHDVWIGRGAIILKNTQKIGIGAVIAAGAVVTKEVPPFAIVAGVPAKIIKYRFPEDIRQKILATKWWDIPHDILTTRFNCEDVATFLLQYDEYVKDELL